jgi:hypothetical protein
MSKDIKNIREEIRYHSFLLACTKDSKIADKYENIEN